jgi:hypothetical protein
MHEEMRVQTFVTDRMKTIRLIDDFNRLIQRCLNSLHDDMQSAYRTGHSTETALLRVHHDITYALDNNACVILLMLDLSSAFDVIDHDILFDRLQYSFGISGSALSWIRSYLTDRSQCISI